MNSAADRARDLSLQDAIRILRREVVSALWVAVAVGTFATIAYYLLAQFRYLLYPLALPARSDATVLGIAALLAFWALVFACLSYLRERLQISLGFRLAHRLAVPAILAEASPGNERRWGNGQALHDIDEVVDCIRGPILTTAVDAALVPVMILLLSTVHWAMLLVALVSAVLKLGMSLLSYGLLSGPLDEGNAANFRAVAGIADAANAAEAIEAMGFLPALARRWADDIHGGVEKMASARRRLRLLQAVSMTLDAIMALAPITLMTSMALLGIDPGVSGVTGMIALMVMPRIVSPFSSMISHASEFASGRRAWERLQALAVGQQGQAQEHSTFPCPQGRLELDRLTVVLPGMPYPIIRDLGFRMEPGQVVGLSGPVGCGKSTLLRTIMGIRRPTSGGCYLDGHATWQWDRKDFARYVGYLPQDLGLTDGTVADAIARLGEPDMALVLEAAYRSGAHDFIVDLPNGYATRLSEFALSAGQRQRLGLARAIYGRPRLVILDEPGAWLDAEGFAQLRRLIRLLRQDRTSVLFTSHEAGLLEEADHNVTLGMPGTPPRATNRNRALVAKPQGAAP